MARHTKSKDIRKLNHNRKRDAHSFHLTPKATLWDDLRGRTLKVLAIQLWVALVHNAGGLGLPEQPGLQHAQESTGGPEKKRGCY